MGCWDAFCFACGNTCHSMLDGTIENIKEIYDIVDQKKKIYPFQKKFYLKVYDAYKKDPHLPKRLQDFQKNFQWLNHCTFLTVTDEVIHHCQEVSCNIEFKDKKGNLYFQDIYHDTIHENNIKEKLKSGIFIHDDCWNFIKSKYKIELKFSDVAVIPKPRLFNKINPTIDYGNIEKYWSQNFDFIEMFIDTGGYMSESPLKNKQNALRIQKIISQFKFNTDKKRTGPSVSATFYPEKTIKYGINKKLWIKKNGKWSPLPEETEKKTIEIDLYQPHKKIMKIHCMGQQTLKPILILNMNEKKKNIGELEFIGTPKELSKL